MFSAGSLESKSRIYHVRKDEVLMERLMDIIMSSMYDRVERM
jgi:hypothetical protein